MRMGTQCHGQIRPSRGEWARWPLPMGVVIVEAEELEPIAYIRFTYW